jgi:hypothetical protein
MARNLGNTAMNTLIPPAQAAGGPSNERWMQDLGKLPGSRGTLPPPPPGGGTTVATSGPVNINRLREAIVGKESGGNFSAVNPDSGALGIGQVMPANVPSWTQKHYGRRLTPKQFLANKEAQIAVVNGQMNEILQQQLKAGYDVATAIRRTASIWYSGQGNLFNDTKPQYTNGQRYPSIREYTFDILRRYNRSSVEPNEELGNQFIAQLEAEGGYEDTAFVNPMVVKKAFGAVSKQAVKIYQGFDKRFNATKPPAASQKAPADANARIAAAAEKFRDQSTAAGPGGGDEACAWAVNKVLKNAGIKVPWVEAGQEAVYIPFIEEAVRKGAATTVQPERARPGDIVNMGGAHMGIVINKRSPDGKRWLVLSNSSSQAKFSWEFDLPPRALAEVYRIKPAK